jgi:hypothetical protein
MADFGWLAMLAAACGGYVAVHIFCFRIIPAAGLYLSQLVGFVAGLAVLAAGSWYFAGLSVGRWLAELCIYLCFGYCFFHFNNMGETARRVRLAIELHRAPQGLTRAELLVRYGAREIIDRRLARLLESGQIRERQSHYVLGNRSVLVMARIVALFKLVLNMTDSV